MHLANFKFYRSRDWIVIIFLTIVIIATLIFFHFGGRNTSFSKSGSNDTSTTFIGKNTQYYNVGKRNVEEFPFDPNTADSTQLLRLGLAPFQVRNIYRYRAAGGVYSRPEDFARLYGLTQRDYRRLRPYIRIAPDFRPAAELVEQHDRSYFTGTSHTVSPDTLRPSIIHKIKQGETISLDADTTALRTVPGIGTYFSRRIADYGNRLGGYVSSSQLLEIEGFPEESISFFTPSATIKRIDVNNASISRLCRHPYISFQQAREIVNLHRRNGPLHSIDDLRLSPLFTANDLKRLTPYLNFSNN